MVKKKILYLFFFTAILFIGFISGRFFENKHYFATDSISNGQVKIDNLLQLISREYVDKVHTDSVVDVAIQTILNQLDPYSVYIPIAETEQEKESLTGIFVGIGVNYNYFNDTLAVITSIENSPAFKAGIRAGDRILFADHHQLFNKVLSNDSLSSIIKGRINSKITLKVYRKTTKELLTLNVVRQEIPLKSVDVALKLNDTLGYIKINRFSETTSKEFKKNLAALLSNETKSLVLDLRDNIGGYIQPAIEIADIFLTSGDLIVKTVNKQGKTMFSKATSSGEFKNGSLTVLINENTASASEIIAGAIQDNDRGTIVGRRSYGKGLVQQEMNLGDGSSVRLTTARYYTPSGRSIQKPYKSYKTYASDISKRFETGELYSKDSIRLADSLQFKTKKGRIVYGGGGIVPDIFISSKARKGQDAIELLMKTSLVSYFVFEQIDKNRLYLEQLTVTGLIEEIFYKAVYYQQLKEHLIKNGLTFNLDRHKKTIMFYLVAEYLHQLKSEQDYFYWLLKEDVMITTLL